MINPSFFRALCRPFIFLSLLSCLFFTTPSFGSESIWTTEETLQTGEPIVMGMLAEEESIQPGRSFWVALPIEIEAGWHTYWKNPGQMGMGCKVDWQLPAGMSVKSLHWPTPKRYVEETLSYFGYEGPIMLLAEIMPSKDFQDQEAVLSATLHYVACNAESCVPGDSHQTLKLPVKQTPPKLADHQIPLFAEGRRLLPDSTWKAEAIRNSTGVIALTLAAPQGVTVEEKWEADFFPEEGKNVSVQSQLEKLSSNHYRLLLTAENAHNPASLEGVVVLKNSQDAEDYKAALAVHVPVQEASSSAGFEPQTLPLFSYAFLFTLACAFLGGALLNCMPCVLPVISVKLMQLMKMAGGSRKVLTQHAISYTIGILVSFWALAGAIFLLRTYGQLVGWGFQLQQPLFVAFLALALFLFALNLFGLFEWGMLFASWAGGGSREKSQSSCFGAFCSGVLATAMATPCTGPFLGSAVGLAVTLPASMGLLIFTSIGLGMSLPYTLLTISPRLMRYLPKPGAWMMRFKEAMGFLLLATVLWLVYVFAAQTSLISTLILLTALLLASFGAWIYGNWSAPVYSNRVRWVSSGLSALLIAVSSYAVVMSANPVWKGVTESSSQAPNDWVAFSPEAVEEVVRSGKPALVDFTASWCLICQANHYVFETQRVRDQFDKHGVVKFKADWTLSDPIITEALRKHGRSGVPLYLLYAPYSQQPIILPQLLTPESMLRFLKTMHEQDSA